MRKSVLILGIVYLIFGVFQIFSFSRLLTMYQELDVVVPLISYLFTSIFPVAGIILLASYFLKLKHKTYTVIFFVFLLLGIAWFSYISVGSKIVNNKIRNILENFGI